MISEFRLFFFNHLCQLKIVCSSTLDSLYAVVTIEIKFFLLNFFFFLTFLIIRYTLLKITLRFSVKFYHFYFLLTYFINYTLPQKKKVYYSLRYETFSKQ